MHVHIYQDHIQISVDINSFQSVKFLLQSMDYFPLVNATLYGFLSTFNQDYDDHGQDMRLTSYNCIFISVIIFSYKGLHFLQVNFK